MEKLLISEILSLPEAGVEVTVEGWVRSLRDSKNVAFIVLSDGSTMDTIQVVISPETTRSHECVPEAKTGAAVRVSGILVDSPGKGQHYEVQATSLEIVGPSDESFPLQKKRHTFEYLRTISHLRVRSNTFGGVFRIRSRLAFAIHKFYNDRGFMYVHSPIITASDCEGAGQMFKVTTLDIDNPPRNSENKIDYTVDFFGKPTNLTVSGQLDAEVFAQAFTRVYTFGPTFRAENSNTPRHIAEFWMIEPEVAFCDLMGDLALAEEFIKYLIRDILDNCGPDVRFFNDWIDKGLINRLEHVANSNFEVMTYTDAVEALKKSGRTFEFMPEWGCDLQTEHERYLTEELVKKPVFVINYPREIKAFYMRANDDMKTVAAMDLLVPKIGEIIGGSQREERLNVLEARMEEMAIDPHEIWWYLDLRRYGSTPHAGFGLGFERMVMYVTGMENIRDVIPFARTPKNCEF